MSADGMPEDYEIAADMVRGEAVIDLLAGDLTVALGNQGVKTLPIQREIKAAATMLRALSWYNRESEGIVLRHVTTASAEAAAYERGRLDGAAQGAT